MGIVSETRMSVVLIYHGEVNAVGARNIESLCIEASAKGAEKVTLCICSGGGDVISGIGVYHFLRMAPIAIETYCFGLCGSVAATMFLGGSRRIISPTSMLSLHAATFTKGARQGEISPSTTLISEPFRAELGWDDARCQHYFGSADETYLLPQKALDYGVVHEIRELKWAASDTVITVHIPDASSPSSKA